MKRLLATLWMRVSRRASTKGYTVKRSGTCSARAMIWVQSDTQEYPCEDAAFLRMYLLMV